MIIGWQNILLYTGLSRQFIERAMKLYGFPQATRSARKGKALYLVWDREEVLAWMTANPVMVKERLEMRRRMECSF
jgi:predicted DNA-binding transcriptional regulator AlpA